MLAEFLQMWDVLLDNMLENILRQLSDEQIESDSSDFNFDLFSDEYEAVHSPSADSSHHSNNGSQDELTLNNGDNKTKDLSKIHHGNTDGVAITLQSSQCQQHEGI